MNDHEGHGNETTHEGHGNETDHEHQGEVFVQSTPAIFVGILLLGLCLGGMVVGIKKVAAGMSNPRPDGDVAHVTLDEAEKDPVRY